MHMHAGRDEKLKRNKATPIDFMYRSVSEVRHSWTLLTEIAGIITDFFVSQQTSSQDFYRAGPQFVN